MSLKQKQSVPTSYKDLEKLLKEIVFSHSLEIYPRTTKEPTPDKPFNLNRIYLTDNWLIEKLTTKDFQTMLDLFEISNYGKNLIPFSEHFNPTGIQAVLEYTHNEQYMETEFSFLMKYADKQIKERYRLLQLFADQSDTLLTCIDEIQFSRDVQATGERLAEELSKTLTTSINPLYEELHAHMEAFTNNYQKT